MSIITICNVTIGQKIANIISPIGELSSATSKIDRTSRMPIPYNAMANVVIGFFHV